LYPSPGFGRSGCYTGRGIGGWPASPIDSTLRPDPQRPSGAWVVFDSLTAHEIKRWESDPRGGNATIIVTRVDTAIGIFASWSATTADSIELHDWAFPSEKWTLRRDGADLRGAAVMHHDMRHQLPDGTWVGDISIWQVWLVPVPCSTVPTNALLPK
jgi:hypothetical protein